MNISFPINIILRKGLTADDYTICVLLLEKRYGLLKLLHALAGNYMHERILKLIDEEYLKFNGLGHTISIKEVEVTDKFKSLLSAGDLFEELYNKFPIKVSRPDGKEDYLRVDKAKCRIKYKKLTDKNKLLHQHVIECLDREVKYREKFQTMGYFKRLSNWIEGEEWKKYEDDPKEAKLKRESSNIGDYGTNIL